MPPLESPAFRPPALLIHCDWGSSPKKRWMACAGYHAGTYVAGVPKPTGDPGALLSALREKTPGPILVGFDFPIGLPLAYAERVQIASFPAFLRTLAQACRSPFFEVCRESSEISLERPFYPFNFTPKGSRKRAHLVAGLNLTSFEDLLRICERSQENIPAAGALFWTLGAQAPGRAALHGWAETILPALGNADVKLWPFDGYLADLLEPGNLVIAETYPTQYHPWILQTRFTGKGKLESRKQQASPLLYWAAQSGVRCDTELEQTIHEGFPQGDDAFDAVLGLFGMLHLILNPELHHEPTDPTIRDIEGWILGQPSR